MKKICFITTIPATLDTFVLETSKYLHDNGNYDITFISNYDKKFEDKLPDYIYYIPVNMKRGISISGISAICKIFKIFKKEKFDIIQYSTPNAAFYSSIAGKLAKIKNRLYCQWGIRYVGFKGIKRKIFKIIEKIICMNSTWIEPDSFGNLRFSHKEGLYNKSKSSVIWNGSAKGIDLNRFDITKKDLWKKDIAEKYGLQSKFVVGFVGRLDKDKGVNELFEAFKNLQIDNKKLLIIGSNDKKDTINQELYNWAKDNKDIVFTGPVKDIEKYYSVMDIFVLPSYREGFGSVVIEAEAMGVPVIVTDIPGPTEALKENETGIIIKKESSEQLKKAMEKLFQDKQLREEMSKNASKFAKEKFDKDKLYKYILEDRDNMLIYKERNK